MKEETTANSGENAKTGEQDIPSIEGFRLFSEALGSYQSSSILDSNTPEDAPEWQAVQAIQNALWRCVIAAADAHTAYVLAKEKNPDRKYYPL